MKSRLALATILVGWLITQSLHGQVQGFDDYDWQQKDSVITTLFYGGALNVCDVLIETAYQAELGKSPQDNKAMAVFANWQGIRYLAHQSLDTAEHFLSEALTIYQANPPLQDSAYRDVLLNLGDLKSAQGAFEDASDFYRKAEAEMDKGSKLNKQLYLNTLTTILSSELQINNLDQAEEYGKKALGFAQKNYGEKTDEYFSALTNLGKIYQLKGQTRRAANVILQAYELAKINLPPNHRNLLLYANYAAEVHASLGRLSAMGAVYDDMIAFFEENPNEQESTLYPTILEKKAAWHEAKNELDTAYQLYNRANILLSLRAERTSPEYIRSEVNMANILRKQEKYLEAEGYYQSALQYAPQVYGADSWSMAVLQENLGDMYMEMSDYNKALEHRQAALTLFEMHLQDEDPTYALALQKMGQTHSALGLDSLAGENLKQAQKIFRDIYGAIHPLLYGNCLRLIKLYWDRDQETVLENLKTAGVYAKYALLDNIALLSSSERRVVYEEIDELINLYASLAIQTSSDEVLDDLLALVTAKKVSKAQSNLVSIATLQSKHSTQFRKEYNNWQELRKHIFDNQNLPAAQQKNTQSRRDQAWEILAKLVPGYRNFDPKIPSGFEVRNKLPTGEVFVDLLAFKPYQAVTKDFAEKEVFVALVNRGQSRSPKLIQLTLNQNALSTSQSRNQAAYYQQLWAPIETSLASALRIYISPDQVLHRISYSSLPTNDGGYVFDNYQIQRINSAVDLFQLKDITPQKEALIYAAPSYSSTANAVSQTESQYDLHIPSQLVGTKTSRDEISFSANSGSIGEANAIKNLLSKKKWQVESFQDQQVSVPGMREQLPGAQGVVHLAMKAYFVQPDSTNELMLTCGIAATGAKSGWTGDTLSGIISALELSAMDLQNIDLLVIGYHEINYGSSLAALHRALKFAGVKNILLTLWDVPAEGRRAFFTLFYKNLAKNQSIHTALYKTKKKMRKKFDTINWGGFVLLES